MNDKDIYIVNDVICKNLDSINNDIGLASQNVLPHIRTIVELISIKIYGVHIKQKLTNKVVTNKKRYIIRGFSVIKS